MLITFSSHEVPIDHLNTKGPGSSIGRKLACILDRKFHRLSVRLTFAFLALENTLYATSNPALWHWMTLPANLRIADEDRCLSPWK
jgi:hypothetical protein